MLMSFYQHYARRRKHPLGAWVHRRQARKLADLVGLSVIHSGHIVEIGPGDGYFGEICLQTGFRYTAVEASPEVANQLRERGMDFRSSFVPPIPMETGSADACCLFHVLEHMVDATHVDRLIKETRRILKPGGILVMVCPNYYTWGRDFFEADYTHN